MLFGAYQIDSNAQWSDGARPDYKNSLVFGNNDPDLGVIALKTTWYTLLGIKIVDYDISFKTDYTWGDAAINAIKMDLQNIATHETDTGQDFLTCTTPALEKRCMALNLFFLFLHDGINVTASLAKVNYHPRGSLITQKPGIKKVH